jgi:hypothetical protein
VLQVGQEARVFGENGDDRASFAGVLTGDLVSEGIKNGLRAFEKP